MTSDVTMVCGQIQIASNLVVWLVHVKELLWWGSNLVCLLQLVHVKELLWCVCLGSNWCAWGFGVGGGKCLLLS